MCFQAGRSLLGCLVVAAYISLNGAMAQEPLDVESEGTSQILGRLERRLDDLEAQNQSLLGENTRLFGQLNADQTRHFDCTVVLRPHPCTGRRCDDLDAERLQPTDHRCNIVWPVYIQLETAVFA